MKILVFPGFFYPHVGGVEKSAMDFVQACQAKGWKVKVVTRLDENSLPFEIVNKIPVHRIRYAVLRLHQKNLINAISIFTKSSVHLFMIVLKFRPDLIYVHMLSENAVMAGLLTYLYRSRLIISFRGRDMILYKNNRINKSLFQRLLDKAERISAPSELLIRRVKSMKEYSLDMGKIRIIPNGIDLERFDKMRNTFVLSNEKSYIFACGGLFFDKGFDILIRAFALVCGVYPTIDLVIAGEGGECGNLKSLAINLNIAQRVHLIGEVSWHDLIPYYRGCLFFVIPSRQEAFGNVTLEAMAASKAVIGSAEAVADGLIQEDFNGCVFDSEDYKMLAEKMKWLIEDNEKRTELGVNARRFIEQNYSQAIFQERIAELLVPSVL